MKVKYVLLILSLILGTSMMSAQEKKRHFDLEAFRKERAAFFIKGMKLTDTEAKAFIPVLDDFMSKKFAINRENRQLVKTLREKSSKTEDDYRRVIETHIEVKVKEADLEKEYYEKFTATIPLAKLVKFHKVEMDFMKQVLERRKSQR